MMHPTRTFISTISSVDAFKHEVLSFYSDMHKDHYGCRYVPVHLLDSEHTMEEVMEAMDSLLATIHYEREDDNYEYTPTLFTNTQLQELLS